MFQVLLIPALHFLPALHFAARASRRRPDGHTRAEWRSIFYSPISGAGGRNAIHDSRGASAAGRFWFPVQN